jgi:hypothetical protein
MQGRLSQHDVSRQCTPDHRLSTPAIFAEACEAIRLAIGGLTRVTAKLAYPSSRFGRSKETESPGYGSPQNERDASLISLRFGDQ